MLQLATTLRSLQRAERDPPDSTECKRMLVQLGRRGRQPASLVDMLLACHERIRSFIALAQTAARQESASDEEIAEACRAVEKYFVEALPLHVQDEEQSILPRLIGQSLELDACLQTMCSEHEQHQSQLDVFLAACAELRRAPRDLCHRARLQTCAAALSLEFGRHLALEEALLFTAVEQLPDSTQATIVAELRERRRAQGALP